MNSGDNHRPGCRALTERSATAWPDDRPIRKADLLWYRGEVRHGQAGGRVWPAHPSCSVGSTRAEVGKSGVVRAGITDGEPSPDWLGFRFSVLS